MKQLKLLNIILLLGCFAPFATMAQISANKSKKPNIVLVMADDQGWGDVGYYGHPVIKTPNLDEMSKSGLRFDQFYSAAPVCSPTRGSILTGRHPNRYGVFKYGEPIRPQEKTVAAALKKAGYITSHFGKWHLGSVFAGSPVNPGACGFDEWVSSPNFYDNDPTFCHNGIAVKTKGESSMVTVDAAIDFMRKHFKSAQPFFSVVWFGSPHKPYLASEQDRAIYAGLDEKLQNYYGEITGMDRAIGKLRQELKTLGIDKNTIFWFCSDNGGVSKLSATGGRGNKSNIYEGGLRVPAILEWPARIRKARETNIPVNTSDIYPTLLEIADVKVSGQPVLDGVSLVKLIDNKMTSREKPMGFWQYPRGGKIMSSKKLMTNLFDDQKNGISSIDSSRLCLDAGIITKQYPLDSFFGHAAWLDWPFKLHRIEDKTGNVIFELYNLEDDPMEEDNLVEKNIEKVKTLKPPLQNWLLSVVESLNGADY